MVTLVALLRSAMLYDVGFNHFLKRPLKKMAGDFIFAQGHISPGIYGRAFLEGRLTEEQMNNFVRSVMATVYRHTHTRT